MSFFGFRFHFHFSDINRSRAERIRNEIDLTPSMIEWHIRDNHSMNGFK